MKKKFAISMLLGFFSLLVVHGQMICLLDEDSHYDEYKKSAALSSGISVSTSANYIFIQFEKAVGEVSLYLMNDKGDIMYNEELSVPSPVSISIPYIQEGEYILLVIECKEKGTVLQIPIFNPAMN